MSNLIKGYHISYDKEDKRIIDSDSRTEFFKPLKVARVGELSGKEQEEPALGEDASQAGNPMEEEPEDAEASLLFSEAKEQAQKIIEAAMEEAEDCKAQAAAEGMQEGYDAGMAAAAEEILSQKQELMEQQEKMRQEYESRLLELEPAFADILASYIEKLTGIFVEGEKDVILHLISTAIRKVKRSSSFVIRIPTANYPYVESQSQRLLEELGDGVTLDLEEDPSMKENQCIIEADDRIIDCSLDIQLGGLVKDLKLLADA